jgi:signal transduction histidine kinase
VHAAATLLVSPNAADAELATRFLREHGFPAHAFATLRELAGHVDERVGCLVVVDEALVADEIPALREALARLPAWLDLPLVFVGRDSAALGSLAAGAFPDSGQITLLERPLNPHTLASAVLVALRASTRQREVGELIAQREHAVRLRDEFMAMLAHELRNPLAPMRNALHIMRLQKMEDPLLVRSAAILERQVDHIVRMVDDLMDVARLERGKVTLQKQRLDLSRLVASALEGCQPAAQARGHRLVAHFCAGALPVDADPVRLEQIVCNLVNNAVKFMAQPGEIGVETSCVEGEAVIAVQDRGVGFEPDAGEQLFAPFLQVNPTLARSAGGLGIGLTIVRRLVELHGGSVSATSEGPGKGARFVVRLPLAAGLAEPEPTASPARVDGKRCRVVVIEDNADIRETLRTLLDLWGHEVVDSAPDGREGLAQVLERRPDVAIVDIGLPGMSGYDVARAIRAYIPNGAIRLIALTGYGQPADRERAFEAGFDAHLLKPVVPDVLQRELGR